MVESGANMRGYTCGVPVWDEMRGSDPSIYGILESIPGPESGYREPDFRIETSAPFLQSNAAMWILLGLLALWAISGDEKAE